MSWAGGLLTVAGKAGEGGFKGVNKNIDEAIEEKKAAVLEKRLLNLEKVRHGYRTAEDVAQRDFTSEENVVQRDFTAGESELDRSATAEQKRLGRKFTSEENIVQREFTAGENKLDRDKPGLVGKTYNDLVAIGVPPQKAQDLIIAIQKEEATGKDSGLSKLYLDAAKALQEGSPLSAVNASLKAKDAPMIFEATKEGFELIPIVAKGHDSNDFGFDAVFGWGGSPSSKPATKPPKPRGLLTPPPSNITNWDNATKINPY